MPVIKNLVLDLGNVVVDVDYPRFCLKAGIDVDAFEAFYNTPFFRDFETGKKSREDYFPALEKYTGFPAARRKEFERQIHTAFPLRLRTWGLIHFLKQHIPVYLLSNTNVVDFENIDAYVGLRKAFHKVYLSYEQQRSKPDPDTYRHAAGVLGVRPEETLFCDDRQDNIEGVRQAGWHGYKVENEDAFLIFLTNTLKLNHGGLTW
ncbi:MAG: HAD family hydrolase [Fidelibacterota bacterium]